MSALEEGVAAVADVDFDVDEDEGEGELEEALELVADELVEVVAVLAADVTDAAPAVRAAMFAPETEERARAQRGREQPGPCRGVAPSPAAP